MAELDKEGWVKIFTSTDSIDVSLKKSKLAEAEIEVISFNHQDSMLASLNTTDFSVSLYVHQNDVDSAKKAIENQ